MSSQTNSPTSFAGHPAAGYQPDMIRATLRWAYLMGVLFILGPLCARLVTMFPAADGSPASGATLSVSPVSALMAVFAALAIAAVAGLIGARLYSQRTGFFAAGLALVWTPWSIGRMDDLVRVPMSRAVLPALAIDGAIIGALGVAVGLVIWLGSRKGAAGQREQPGFTGGLLGPLIAIGVGGIAAWAVSRSNDAGQALGAATLAALFGTLVGHVVDARSPDRAYLLSIWVLAVASPLIAMLGAGGSTIERVYSGELFPPALIMPLDWVTGALLGIPMGSAWASSMLEKRSHDGHSHRA